MWMQARLCHCTCNDRDAGAYFTLRTSLLASIPLNSSLKSELANVKTLDLGVMLDQFPNRVDTALQASEPARSAGQTNGPTLLACPAVQIGSFAHSILSDSVRLRRISPPVCAQSVATVSERSRSSSQTAPQPGPSGGAIWPSSISGALSSPHSSPSARRRRGVAGPSNS